MSDSAGLVHPSLPEWAARERYRALVSEPRDLAALRARSATVAPEAAWYPTGPRADQALMERVRTLIWGIADEEGFPDTDVDSRRRFDQRLAGPLHETMGISPARAGDPGVWAFLTLVLVPDVAFWRYQDPGEDRLLGGHRNVLRRLWLRAAVLGSGPDDPPARLGEDQLVAILERTNAVGREPRVARALADAFLRRADTHQGGGMLLMREAAKRALRLTAWMALGTLEDTELDALMNEVLAEAASAIGGPEDASQG